MVSAFDKKINSTIIFRIRMKWVPTQTENSLHLSFDKCIPDWLIVQKMWKFEGWKN